MVWKIVLAEFEIFNADDEVLEATAFLQSLFIPSCPPSLTAERTKPVSEFWDVVGNVMR